MLIKCQCCDRYWKCEGNTIDEDLHCKQFIPGIEKIKEYAMRNCITVSDTIELIKLCCR